MKDGGMIWVGGGGQTFSMDRWGWVDIFYGSVIGGIFWVGGGWVDILISGWGWVDSFLWVNGSW